MLCTIYLCRRNGEKLPPDIIRTRPNIGWLVVDQDPRTSTPREVARLVRNEKLAVDVVEPMINVRVRVKRDGLLITGEEEQAGYQTPTHQQTWWCRVGAFDDLSAA